MIRHSSRSERRRTVPVPERATAGCALIRRSSRCERRRTAGFALSQPARRERSRTSEGGRLAIAGISIRPRDRRRRNCHAARNPIPKAQKNDANRPGRPLAQSVNVRHDHQADVEAAWAAEIERRARRALADESGGVAWDDVRRRAEAELRKR
jgi:hypothetical protein